MTYDDWKTTPPDLYAKVGACNADLGHPCDANDGEPCAACAQYLIESEREARRSWAVASPEQKAPEGYERDLREAGRWKGRP